MGANELCDVLCIHVSLCIAPGDSCTFVILFVYNGIVAILFFYIFLMLFRSIRPNETLFGTLVFSRRLLPAFQIPIPGSATGGR